MYGCLPCGAYIYGRIYYRIFKECLKFQNLKFQTIYPYPYHSKENKAGRQYQERIMNLCVSTMHHWFNNIIIIILICSPGNIAS